MAVRIIIDDCLAALRKMPDNSVHCVVTSPPYWGLRSYGMSGWTGGKADCDHVPKKRVARKFKNGQNRISTGTSMTSWTHRDGTPIDRCAKCGANRQPALEIGSEPTLGQHVAKMVDVFREIRRVLREDGTLWLNYGDVYASSVNGRKAEDIKKLGKDDRTFRDKPVNTVGGVLKPKDLALMPARIAMALQADGWWLRSDIIWHKPNPMPESILDRPTTCYEHVFLFAKSERYYFDAEAVREPTLSTYDPRTDQGRIEYTRHKRDGKDGLNEAFVKIDSAGRNIRNLWTIPAAGFPGAHFATFPVALVEPCLKAGASLHGCCALCNAPYVRVTELTGRYAKARGDVGDYLSHDDDAGRGRMNKGLKQRQNIIRDKHGITSKETVTTGWQPSCKCKTEQSPSRCVVMDPFGGAGTVGLVADQLGFSAILIELNPAYAKLAQKRIKTERGLMAPSVTIEQKGKK